MPKKLYIVTQSVFNIQHFVSVTYTALLQFDVGVRNLIKECKKYLFHSLYTKKHICICRCVFLMKHISMYEKFNDKRREIFSPLILSFKSDNAPFKCIKYKHLFAESKCYVDPVVFVVNTHNYAFTEFVVFNSRANNYS